MNLVELFDKDTPGKVGEASSLRYEEAKEIGDYEVSFQARKESNGWEVFFIAIDHEGNSGWDPTGAGNEVQVFSYIVSAMRRFVKKYDPQRIQFSSKKIEGSRTKLYQRFVKRFLADTYIAREFEVGMGSAEKYIQFDLIKKPD